MAPARSAWSAAIEKAPHGGVYLHVVGPVRSFYQEWFPTQDAAMASAQGRQFVWRSSSAIGSPVLKRGDLLQWGNE